MLIVHPIEPVYDNKSKILILGSFPSVKSREVGFYYGHPQNRFWRVLQGVLESAADGHRCISGKERVSSLCGCTKVAEAREACSLHEFANEEKKKFLLEAGIAIWDVIESCTIEGSSDTSISNVVVNDLSRILDNSNVQVIYINGSKAYELYNKYLRRELEVKYSVLANAVVLPSTSPANAAWNIDKLVGAWRRILIGLGKPLCDRTGSDTAKLLSYYSLSDFAKASYGHKLYKLSLDGGFTCPNRDGKLGFGGCIFCDGDGSGAFAGAVDDGMNAGILCSGNDAGISYSDTDIKTVINDVAIETQLRLQKALVAGKLPKNGGYGYIAYFQAYTGTYGEIDKLRELYMRAAEDAEVEVISIATRPDCLGEEVLLLLSEINKIKPVWIELGLQTIHSKTATYIRRGYELRTYNRAVKSLQQIGIEQIITHVILGLPGEDREDMLETVRYVSETASNGIKLQLLHVLDGTDLAADYKKGSFEVLSMEAYIDILCESISLLPPDMVVHRLTGDGDKRKLIAPMWSGDKKRVLNEINRALL